MNLPASDDCRYRLTPVNKRQHMRTKPTIIIQSESNQNRNQNRIRAANQLAGVSFPLLWKSVQSYCGERENKVDAVKFWEYYEAGGWKDARKSCPELEAEGADLGEIQWRNRGSLNGSTHPTRFSLYTRRNTAHEQRTVIQILSTLKAAFPHSFQKMGRSDVEAMINPGYDSPPVRCKNHERGCGQSDRNPYSWLLTDHWRSKNRFTVSESESYSSEADAWALVERACRMDLPFRGGV